MENVFDRDFTVEENVPGSQAANVSGAGGPLLSQLLKEKVSTISQEDSFDSSFCQSLETLCQVEGDRDVQVSWLWGDLLTKRR